MLLGAHSCMPIAPVRTPNQHIQTVKQYNLAWLEQVQKQPLAAPNTSALILSPLKSLILLQELHIPLQTHTI